MKWPWQRRIRTNACPQPRLLPSATAGVCFEALFTITWRPLWRFRPNAEEHLRTNIHATAQRAAASLDAADLPAAQDTVNAALACAPSADAYRLVAARALLRLSPASKEALAQQQADERRIRRLQFLKTHLYDHPELVVLDRLEHRSPGALDNDHVAELQRLSRLIKSCDRWWAPLLQQWEDVGKGFNTEEQQQRAMLTLLNALKRLDNSIEPDLSGLPQHQSPNGQGPR
jgi:hypothetical protein